MADERTIDYGETAYNAYAKSTGGVSLISGDRLPAYGDLNVKIRAAWSLAAAAVIRRCRAQVAKEIAG